MTDHDARSPRSTGGRAALGGAVAVLGVVGVSFLASGIRDGEGSGVRLSSSASQGTIDAISFALLTMGLAVTIAAFVVQFGAGREERTPASTRRRLLVAVVLVGVVVVAAPAVGRIADRLDLADRGDTTAEPAQEDGQERGSLGLPVADAAEEEADGRGALLGLAVGMAVVAAVAVALRVRAGRPPPELPPSDDEALARERQLLAGLLDDAIAALRADPDPRRAVISAWARLEVALAAAGRPRRDAEGPRAYLERILVDVAGSAASVRRLGASFERARFSPHAIGADEQQEAVDALVAVRDELGVVPAP